MSPPILVTGGIGTLGGQVARLLRDRGAQVRVLRRKPRSGHDGAAYVGDQGRQR
jgi:uncharacterized protein YbjT (DUF2867 family)